MVDLRSTMAAFLLLALPPLTLSFKVEMIHRDSPRSPHYNLSITKFERVRRAVDRSFGRQNSLSLAPWSAGYAIRASAGEYLMRIFFGTQEHPVWAIVDTGSDLTWTQCYPCEACYPQYAAPYNPRLSKTYELASCTDPLCEGLGVHTSCGFGSRCNYLYGYGDGSYTAGNLATDQISFRSSDGNVSFSGVYVGCGYANGGLFSPRSSGLIGLSNSPLSFISQIEVTKFSYCLPDLFSIVPGTIIFGPAAEVSGRGLVTTPLIPSAYDQFYHLTILGFRVGSTEIKSSRARQMGNTIIDSGTTLTFLPADLVDGITAALAKSIKCRRNSVVEQQYQLALCYNVASKGCIFTVPPVVVHFLGGDLNLPETNTFIELLDGVKCFTIVGSQGLSIWGNTAQMSMKTEYDLQERRLKFLPADCSKPN